MKRTIDAAVLLVGSMAWLGPGVAWSGTLRTGTRVRVTVAESTMLFGTLASADETTISLLRPDGEGPLVIPRTAIAHLHFHQAATPNRTGRGIVLGFLGGLALGTAYGILGHPPFGHAYEMTVLHEGLAYGVLFSVPGAVIGGLEGAGHEGGWREVPVDSRVRVGLSSTGRSAGVRVAVSW
jgi:hypothetical protein